MIYFQRSFRQDEVEEWEDYMRLLHAETMEKQNAHVAKVFMWLLVISLPR